MDLPAPRVSWELCGLRDGPQSPGSVPAPKGPLLGSPPTSSVFLKSVKFISGSVPKKRNKNPFRECLLSPGPAVNSEFSFHPHSLEHYPHCRTGKRGSWVAQLTPALSAHHLRSAQPRAARSPGAAPGRASAGPSLPASLQQAFSGPEPGRPQAKGGFFHTLLSEPSRSNPQWSSCLIWKKSKKPDKKLSVYQHGSSRGHTTEPIVLLTVGNLCPRGP